MWQKEYKKKKIYCGSKPDRGLKEAIKYTPKGVVLDIGAGEGRNSIFLAKNGFEVEAVDKTPEGLERCKKFAKKHDLSIKIKAVDIRKFGFKRNKYSLVLSVAALDFLKFSEIQKIILKIRKSLKRGGIFYFVGCSIKDSTFKKCERKLKMVEKNTFYLPKFKTLRHFFEKKEVLNLLKGLKIIKIEEKKIKEVHSGELHFHWVVRTIIKK